MCTQSNPTPDSLCLHLPLPVAASTGVPISHQWGGRFRLISSRWFAAGLCRLFRVLVAPLISDRLWPVSAWRLTLLRGGTLTPGRAWRPESGVLAVGVFVGRVGVLRGRRQLPEGQAGWSGAGAGGRWSGSSSEPLLHPAPTPAPHYVTYHRHPQYVTYHAGPLCLSGLGDLHDTWQLQWVALLFIKGQRGWYTNRALGGGWWRLGWQGYSRVKRALIESYPWDQRPGLIPPWSRCPPPPPPAPPALESPLHSHPLAPGSERGTRGSFVFVSCPPSPAICRVITAPCECVTPAGRPFEAKCRVY